MAWVETIGHRFQLGERIGAGGMGIVRRGVDLSSGDSVAVKLLHPGQAAERFLREAEVLAKLGHPAIVRYVAHGATEQGRLYIVMEWLDGATLSELLAARSVLSPSNVVSFARRLASGLALAHGQGVVHRDIKPSNVILPGDDLARATLIDFGVARRAVDPHLTQVGLLIGTTSYMSPEQASGERNPQPASDIFSLGSLLYRALSGRHPFEAGDATATLAKVLLDEPVRPAEIEPRIPGALDDLVFEMLSKRPEDRPADGSVLFDRLDALGELQEIEQPTPPEVVRSLGAAEQRVVWVVLAGGSGSSSDAATQQITHPAKPPPGARAAAVVAGHRARWDVLADGTGVASFSDAGGDRGERATRLARDLHRARPDRPMALSMGLGVVGRRAPVGQALDRAVKSLSGATMGEIHVDEETASVLDPRELALTREGKRRLTRVERPADETRKLLGRITPCVGRERELVTLEALVDQCVHDSVARVSVVVGPTGIGKSRLRYELLNRMRERGIRAEFLIGRADSLSAGSPFALLREALRRSARILDGEPIGESRTKLLDRVRRVLGASARAFDVAVFLGELANVPFDDADSDALRAARRDPRAMGDAIRGAWLDYIGAECTEKLVVLVLEDLQWGDRPTVALVDAALGAHRERPLLVLALARPEVRDLLPHAFVRREPVEITLRPLHRKACRSLVEDVLGAQLDEGLGARIVELADGNAFFLEELIRAVADGKTSLPPTVMAIVQARLDGLDPESRRLLRAASVFGMRFWRGAVETLMGTPTGDVGVATALSTLVERELLTERPEAAFPGETELVFRHSIVRETAYAALTEEDRVLGHQKAGGWLSSVGEVDALTLAEHFRRGGEPDKAVRFFLASAEHALEGHDLTASVERAQLALACNPDRDTRGHIAEVLGAAHLWKAEYAEAEHWSLEAAELLETATPRWFAALSEASSSAGALDHGDVLTRVGDMARAAKAQSDDARAAQVMCLARAATGHLRNGRREPALAAIERMTEVGAEATTLTSMIQAWIHHGRSAVAYFTGESALFRSSLELAIEAFDASGDVRAATNDRVNLGFALAALGEYESAEELIENASAQADRLGLAKVQGYARHNLGWIRMQLGRPSEAIELQRQVIDLAHGQGEGLLEGSARAYLSLALSAAGDLEGAEAEARLAATLLEPVPALRPHALAALAQALAALNRTKEALVAAEEALAGADTLTLPEDSDALVRLVAARARHASGNVDAARRALSVSRDKILARSREVGDHELAKSFLERVPEHVQTLKLCQEWEL